MVTELIIDTVATSYEEVEQLEQEIESLSLEQPFLAAYLSQDQHQLLTQEEYSLLWFIVVVLYRSIEQTDDTLTVVPEDVVGTTDEQMWEWLEMDKPGDFTSKLDRFFEATKEEDLLAFIEDMLTSDEDDIVTDAGRPLLFVMAATVIFCLT